MDSRIGKHVDKHGDGFEPKVCAVRLQPCAGRHSSHYAIGDGYYIAILEKAAMGMTADDIKFVRDECRKLVPAAKRSAKVLPMKKVEES